MKLTIELDLAETKKALGAGALAALCVSLEAEEAAQQDLKAKVNTSKTQAGPGVSAPDKTTKPASAASKAMDALTGKPEADPEVEPEQKAPTSPFTEADNGAEPGDEPPFDKDPAEEGKAYTLEEVRAVMADLSKAGKKEEIKKIFASVGATKLTEVAEADYAKVMAKAAAVV